MNISKSNKPLVVIFGRTNAGKSTLFNKLTEKNKALVSNIEGTTRDSNTEIVEWRGKTFILVDTGGIIKTKDLRAKRRDEQKESLNLTVQKQALDYLKKAEVALFLVDAQAGLLPGDKELLKVLKKAVSDPKKILLAANKADNPTIRNEIAEFNRLNLGEPLPVSAASGSGTGDLLDEIIFKIKTNNTEKKSNQEKNDLAESETNRIRVCILGQPNSGKSSLVNSIAKEQRMIVSSLPHTTREPQDTEIIYQNNIITFVDTAGISKRGQKSARQIKKSQTLEKKSIIKSFGALKKADLALLLIDLSQGLSHQDSKLAEEIVSRQAGLVITANKWDLVKEKDVKKYTQYIRNNLPFIKWAPIQFISALTGSKVDKLFDLLVEIDKRRKQKIPDSSLAKFLNKIIKRQRPHLGVMKKRARIYELKQVRSNPPKFTVRIGSRDNLYDSYIKYIENRLREKYNFTGTPINIRIIKKSK